MNEAVLKRNMDALKCHPATYNVVAQALKSDMFNECCIEVAKTGVPTLIWTPAEGKALTYHSRYDPVKEAVRQVASVYKNQTHVLLLGFGLGYMADELFRAIDQVGEPRMFVVEPDPGVFIAALRSRDLAPMLASQSICWCVGVSPDEVGNTWNTLLDWSSMNNLAIVEHSPSAGRFRKYFDLVIEKIRYLCNRSKGNLVTLMHAGSEFHSNYFANLANSFSLPGVGRLFNKFNGVPAIVVAAGPSLDKNMHLLKQVKGRFPIIAVDTALRQLATQGIKPDIACAADPSYENSLDFVGVEDEQDVVLALEPMTHPDIYHNYSGPKMLMSFGGGLYPIMKDYREEVGILICWGSIATTIFDLAKRIGADPIIFMGLDLSFQDGRLHARGSYSDDLLFEKVHAYTSLEHETADYINTRGAFKFTDATGSAVFTDHNMKIYKDWFEDQFRQTTQKVINATEGGIVDKFVEVMTLQQVIEVYGDRGVDVAAIMNEALTKPVKADYDAFIAHLKHLRKIIVKNGDAVRKKVTAIKRLVSGHASKLSTALPGVSKADYHEVLQLHDQICSDTEVFPWFSIHQTKFMTRHIAEVKNLKSNTKATVKDWMTRISEFFAALEKFNEYQLPLLDKAVQSLSEAHKSHTILGGET